MSIHDSDIVTLEGLKPAVAGGGYHLAVIAINAETWPGREPVQRAHNISTTDHGNAILPHLTAIIEAWKKRGVTEVPGDAFVEAIRAAEGHEQWLRFTSLE